MKFKSKGALSKAFERDLKEILKTPPESVTKIVNTYLKHVEQPPRTMDADEIENNLEKEMDLDHKSFVAISRLILYSPTIYTPEDRADFEKKLMKLRLGNEDRDNVLNKIDIIRESGLMKIMYHSQELEKVESFGIKRFDSINFMTDYRIFDMKDENRVLVPVVVANLTLIDEDGSKADTVFQLSSQNLEEFVHSIAEFKSKFDAEREIINDMTYKDTTVGQ